MNNHSIEQPLIWLDLEMTGLNPQEDRIIEIATIITDAQLNIIAQGPVLAVHQEETLLSGMDKWNTKVHGKSGLIGRVRSSDVNESQAEQMTLDFLSEYITPNQAPLCGNSVWQDRRFLERYMPSLNSFFHYRLLDVSTFKECAKRWNPTLYKGFKKEGKHQALDDIKESIEELKYYRHHWLNDLKMASHKENKAG